MKAAVYQNFGGPIQIRDVPDPIPSEQGAVIQVKATGICRSDWWGWQGNDEDIHLPHVPGHEFAGIVLETGSQVHRYKAGDRVTIPFIGACGNCEFCLSGNEQVCDHQYQPGFNGWGSFAEYVSIEFADHNLVRIPTEMDFVETASLGCRFITAFRGIVDQGRVVPGEWVAVFGCGGVGLSCIMIAKAKGARVIAVDVHLKKIQSAKDLGADFGINSTTCFKFKAFKAPKRAVLCLLMRFAHASSSSILMLICLTADTKSCLVISVTFSPEI